jgi:hypothetical protein
MTAQPTDSDPPVAGDEIRDELPAELQPAFAGVYQFPDNSHRRIPGYLYLGVAALCIAFWLAKRGSNAVLVNKGTLGAGIALAIIGTFSISSGWRMRVDEKQALRHASEAVGFAVGHASAQQVWRGLRSRPTWRVLCYSSEEPPKQRGFVLVDAIDGSVVEHVVELNPEDPAEWAELATTPPAPAEPAT